MTPYGCVRPLSEHRKLPVLDAIEQWEGYIDQRVLITFDIKRDRSFWYAEGRVPALGNGRITFDSARGPLPWPSRWRTSLHCDAWGNCELDVFRSAANDELVGAIRIHGVYYDVQMKHVRHGALAQPPSIWVASSCAPYYAEPVRFKSTVEIAGELTIPLDTGPHPGIILLGGGGATDRDGNAFVGHGQSFYRCIADHLTRCGFAVLRTDDRGVRESGGNRGTATLDVLAQDALAAVTFLGARREVRSDCISLLGYSEGANVAAIAASRTSGISSVVLLAPLSVPSGINYIGQLDRRMNRVSEVARRAGRSVEETQRSWKQRIDLERRITTALRAGVKPADLRPQLEVANLFNTEEIDAALDQVASARRIHARCHDPAIVLSKISVPMLVVYFGQDDVVPLDVNEAPLRAAVARGGNGGVSIRIFPEYGHRIGLPEQASRLPAPPRVPAPDVQEFVCSWLIGAGQEKGMGKKRG